MDRIEKDFYNVELDVYGNKVIHVDGYCYYVDGDDEYPCRHLQYRWLYLAPGFTQEQYDEISCMCKQSIRDCSEEEMFQIMDSYHATPLPMSEVTQDTPCGRYVDC